MAPRDRRLTRLIDQLSDQLTSLVQRTPALFALFGKSYGGHGEQKPLARMGGAHRVLALDQTRQFEATVFVPDVARATHGARPRGHPSPERLLRVPAETPLRSAATLRGPRTPEARVVTRVLEEAREHVHEPEPAEGVARRPEFYVIVGRSRRGAKKAVRNRSHELRDRRARGALKGLEDRRLVAHDAGEVGWLEVVKALVVCDVDSVV